MDIYTLSFSPRIGRLLASADGVMVTGSFATGKNTSSSDIDIIILSRKINYIYCESFKDLNQKFQFIFFPYYKCSYILLEEAFKGKGVYSSMFKVGHIIKDNQTNMLARMQKYMLCCNDHRNEQSELSLIYKISNYLEELTTDISFVEKLYIASDIMLSISKLLTKSYFVDSKHNARKVLSNNTDIKFIDSYCNFVATRDSSSFVRDVDFILATFGGRQTKFTTGWVYTFPYSDNLTIFFPSHVIDNRLLGYILSFEDICEGCYSYAFYVGKNQTTEQGVYLYLYSPLGNIPEFYIKLNDYVARNAYNCIKQSIRITFPYKTFFQEGILFGGRNNFNVLTPYFSEIWHGFQEELRDNLDQRGNLARILSTMALYESLKFIDKNKLKEILNELLDKQVLDAIDPNGLYNIDQIQAIREGSMKLFTESYNKNVTSYREIIQGISNKDFDEIIDIQKSISRLYKTLHKIDNELLILPDIFNATDKHIILWMNVVEHLMSIFQLSPIEQFGINYNFTRYINDYDI